MPPDFVSNRPAEPDPRRDKNVKPTDASAADARGRGLFKRDNKPSEGKTDPKQSSPKDGDPKRIAEKRVQQNIPQDGPAGEPSVNDEDGAYGEADVGKEDLETPVPVERRSRLRWKKKEMPGGLWLKCESCGQMIYRKELEEKGMVCPACDFHFTLPGRARVQMVIDEGTFQEKFAELEALDRLEFKDSVLYGEKVRRTVERTKQKEALILGLGTIEERPVVLAVLDFSFMGGSMGEVVGEKVSLACDLARTRREPLVIFTSSGGARMHEGMLSLMQMAKTSAALSSLNQAGGFSICVLTNPTTGGVTASFASVCDITLAEPGALIGFAGPRVIATTLKVELPPGFQRAEFLLEKGQIDRIVRRKELRPVLAQLIDFGARAFGGPRKRA